MDEDKQQLKSICEEIDRIENEIAKEVLDNYPYFEKLLKQYVDSVKNYHSKFMDEIDEIQERLADNCEK